ncbi:response regulator [Nocardioides zeae]|uniref:histidine kinase n=1 Tax=Nocardioides imazamoxiresistens TaxID=3231893 RepID=A0ABU3Q0Q7_9ACTN|nr:response regulator [Nocardioides zeae]MDT9595059.1 response regulator [Nocardioides zeae]
MRHDDLHRQVVQSLSDGILVIDLDGRITLANDAAAALFRTDSATLQGRSLDDFHDETGRGQFREFLDRAARGELVGHEVDSMYVAEDGSRVWVRLMQTGLVQDGSVDGIILRITDNHETKELLDRLSESGAELERAERIARLGSWTWDLVDGEVRHSQGLDELFGQFVDDLLSRDYDVVLGITHPEDHDRLRAALATLQSGEKPRIDVELRQRGEDGWMWLRMRALATYDTEGELIRISGTHQDVTRARATSDQLQDQVTQNSLMQAIASAANEAATLDDVLVHAQAMVVLHDDWERGRAFLPTPDGDLAPRYYAEEDRLEDERRADVAARELATARRALAERAAVWDDSARLTIAFPIVLGEEVVAVVTITSSPPLYRHDMIRSMVEQAGLQLARVAEREQAAREVAAARDRAVEASRHKSEFLATMSHEIRTPLNGIIGLTELLGRTPLDPQQRHLASGIAVSGRSLLGIINDILDFSKIEAGHLEVETIDFEVRDVLDQVTSVLAESARAKGLDLQVSCHPDVPQVLAGDPMRLAQVITNLGSNAVKFTSRGSVTIRATSEPLEGGDAMLRIEVGDTGVGISDEQRRDIFHPFTQADTSTTRRFGGTGLGLAISAELVEAFGGELGVESVVGEGSTFWFTACLGAPTGSQHDARLRRTREKLGRHRLLVVDDNVQNRLILREQLSWWHVTSTGVASVEEARSALTAALDAGDPFDAVLLDLAMPDEDGLALARHVRDDPRLGGLPVVMLSSMTPPTPAQMAELGIAEGLTKPVQANALRDVLLRLLTGAEPPPPDDGPAAGQREGRILVVEDNPVNQVVARGLLSAMGYQVDTADDGIDALTLIEAGDYDVVLMDLQMPRLDGYETTRRLRAREAAEGSGRTPVLAMTAAAITGERDKCLAAGMDDFITKPVAPATLAAALDRWAPWTGSGDGSEIASRPDAPAPGPESTHLDLERLEMLREVSPDDHSYLDRVIGGFSTRIPEIVTELRAAVESDDAAGTARTAHSIKGSALNIGLPPIAELGSELEARGRAGDLAGADDLVLRLEAAVIDAQEALAAYQEWYRSLPPEDPAG